MSKLAEENRDELDLQAKADIWQGHWKITTQMQTLKQAAMASSYTPT